MQMAAVDYETLFQQAEDMTVCNSVLWAVWPTSVLLWMWIWEAKCEVKYQAEEGECSGVLSSV